MNHVQYVIYLRNIQNNPSLFIQESENVATFTYKWGLNMIYDNHQFHISIRDLMKQEEQNFLLSYLIIIDIFAFCISGSDISLPSSYLSISWRHNTESMKFLSYTSK